MKDTKRLIWLDCLRLMAGLSMLGLHCTADSAGQPWPDAEQGQRIAPMLLRAVLYTARTELFLIISVFLLLLALDRRPRRYLATIQEQARRLLIPFLFWTVFYAGYNLIKAGQFGYLAHALDQLSDPWAWLGFLMLGQVKYHMHFLPTLFGIVLMFPLFQLAHRYPVLGLSVIFCLATRQALDGFIYETFWGHELLPFLVRAVKVLTYAGYGLFAGAAFALWQRTAARELRMWAFPVLYLGGLLFLLKLVAIWRTVETAQWQFTYAPGYWADFLMPMLLFALCMINGTRRWPALIGRLAPYSFGIYLCHPIFLDLCEILLRTSEFGPMAQILFKFSMALPATAVLVWALSRSQALAWTIGLGPQPRIAFLFQNKKEAA